MWPRLTWGTAELSDINSMVLNKLCLAERQKTEQLKKKKKRPPSFLTNDNHLFYNASVGERAEPTEGQEAGSGPLWRTNSLYESGLWTLKLSVLQDFDRRRRHVWEKNNNKTKCQNVHSVLLRPDNMHINHSVLWWWYDWMYWRWLAVIFRVLIVVFFFVFFFLNCYWEGSGCRMLKKSIIILIIMIIKVVLLPP